jgi:hypothetical protein
MVSSEVFTVTTVLGAPPVTGALFKLIENLVRVFEPSKVCAVAVLDASNVFDPVFEESKVCEIVELRLFLQSSMPMGLCAQDKQHNMVSLCLSINQQAY